jgi:hypothetical protein
MPDLVLYPIGPNICQVMDRRTSFDASNSIALEIAKYLCGNGAPFVSQENFRSGWISLRTLDGD